MMLLTRANHASSHKSRHQILTKTFETCLIPYLGTFQIRRYRTLFKVSYYFPFMTGQINFTALTAAKHQLTAPNFLELPVRYIKKYKDYKLINFKVFAENAYDIDCLTASKPKIILISTEHSNVSSKLQYEDSRKF